MKKILAISSVLALTAAALTGCGSGMEHEGEYSTDNGRVVDDSVRSRVTAIPGDSDHTAREHIDDAVDGAEDAGKDIIEGIGDAASEIVDGLDGRAETKTTATTE